MFDVWIDVKRFIHQFRWAVIVSLYPSNRTAALVVGCARCKTQPRIFPYTRGGWSVRPNKPSCLNLGFGSIVFPSLHFSRRFFAASYLRTPRRTFRGGWRCWQRIRRLGCSPSSCSPPLVPSCSYPAGQKETTTPRIAATMRK